MRVFVFGHKDLPRAARSPQEPPRHPLELSRSPPEAPEDHPRALKAPPRVGEEHPRAPKELPGAPKGASAMQLQAN